jgi:anti-anti-sigma factor
MKTKIQKNGDQVTIQLSGCLNFETALPFKENLDSLLLGSDETQVIFDFSNLSFVGSCGITGFVQTLRDFNGRAQRKPLYRNVQSEFKRIISAFDASNSFEFGENPLTASSAPPSLKKLLDN